MAALSAGPSFSTGEPPEKSIVFASWIGTACGGAWRVAWDAYIQSAAAAVAAPITAGAMRPCFNEGIVGQRRAGRNNTCG